MIESLPPRGRELSPKFAASSENNLSRSSLRKNREESDGSGTECSPGIARPREGGEGREELTDSEEETVMRLEGDLGDVFRS